MSALHDPLHPHSNQAAAAAAASATSLPRVDTVLEGEIKSATTGLIYPNIDSCITITLVLSDDTLVGAHCVQEAAHLQLKSRDIVEAAKKIIGSRGIKEIVLMGDEGWPLGAFNPHLDGESVSNLVLAAYFAKIFNTPHVRFARAHGTLSIQRDTTSQMACQEKGSPLPLHSPWDQGICFEDLAEYFNIVPDGAAAAAAPSDDR